MTDDRPALSRLSRVPPTAFEAFDDIAAYVSGEVPRYAAMTEAREACSALVDDYTRRDLRVCRVFLRAIAGPEAEDFFEGEYETGWIECSKDTPGAIPMWKVEPKR